MALIVALMYVTLALDAPTRLLCTPGIERCFIYPNDRILIGQKISNQSRKLHTLSVNRLMVCNGLSIDSRCGPKLDLGAQVEVPESSH